MKVREESSDGRALRQADRRRVAHPHADRTVDLGLRSRDGDRRAPHRRASSARSLGWTVGMLVGSVWAFVFCTLLVLVDLALLGVKVRTLPAGKRGWALSFLSPLAVFGAYVAVPPYKFYAAGPWAIGAAVLVPMIVVAHCLARLRGSQAAPLTAHAEARISCAPCCAQLPSTKGLRLAAGLSAFAVLAGRRRARGGPARAATARRSRRATTRSTSSRARSSLRRA